MVVWERGVGKRKEPSGLGAQNYTAAKALTTIANSSRCGFKNIKCLNSVFEYRF
ncbi:hypothetical protein KY285_031134 [Solanum tuberosum]|nr:hypothetical protein KY285_031134 [Solanum tuberosum]